MLKVDDNFLDINECMYQPIYCLVPSQTSEVFEMWSLKCEVHDMKIFETSGNTHQEFTLYARMLV